MSALRFHPRLRVLNRPLPVRAACWLALFAIDIALAAIGHDWAELRRESGVGLDGVVGSLNKNKEG